jgi:hypothetical protein
MQASFDDVCFSCFIQLTLLFAPDQLDKLQQEVTQGISAFSAILIGAD